MDGDFRRQVEQVMTRVPKCVAPETTAYELVKVFHTKGFRPLLVTNYEGLLVGVVSDRDVLRCFGGPNHSPRREELESITVAELMSTDLITVGPDVPMQRAVGLMLQQGISCLPVLENGLLALALVPGVSQVRDMRVLANAPAVWRPAFWFSRAAFGGRYPHLGTTQKQLPGWSFPSPTKSLL